MEESFDESLPPDGKKTISVKDMDSSPAKSSLFKSCTSASVQDAVLNTATVWKHIWRKSAALK
jgi:hypothetical protein